VCREKGSKVAHQIINPSFPSIDLDAVRVSGDRSGRLIVGVSTPASGDTVCHNLYRRLGRVAARRNHRVKQLYPSRTLTRTRTRTRTRPYWNPCWLCSLHNGLLPARQVDRGIRRARGGGATAAEDLPSTSTLPHVSCQIGSTSNLFITPLLISIHLLCDNTTLRSRCDCTIDLRAGGSKSLLLIPGSSVGK